MVERLAVYLQEKRVGCIAYDQEANSREFSYDADYLTSPGAFPISMSLPLQTEPFDSLRTRLFFENLLPPEVIRRKLEKILHVDCGNYLAFLNVLGGDCAGAISLYPENFDPKNSEELVRDMSEAGVMEMFSVLPDYPLLQGAVENYRVSIAGAQDKVAVRFRDGRIGLPFFGTASTHIAKPAMARCETSVENEWFCQNLAQDVGISSAISTIARIKDKRYYITERFDREEIDGHVRRCHQEDFCQAMGVDSERKYQVDGGPSATKCFRFLRENSFGLADQMRFVDFFVYNFLIGNADAHAKNFAFLYDNGKPSVAPLYDSMSTLVYPQVYNSMAMEIGGLYEFKDVDRASFTSFAEKCDLKPKAVLDRLDALAAKLPRKAEELKEEISDDGFASPVYDEIIDVIKRHIEQTAKKG